MWTGVNQDYSGGQVKGGLYFTQMKHFKAQTLAAFFAHVWIYESSSMYLSYWIHNVLDIHMEYKPTYFHNTMLKLRTWLENKHNANNTINSRILYNFKTIM